jgi:HD superfamily phosphohydrolase
LDVDKYDYIARDSYVTGIQSKFNYQRLVKNIKIIQNNICYQEQSIGDIIELYTTRYKLHKTVYTHKAVISAQYMIIEIFKYIDKIIGLADSVNDMDKFCEMTDEYILTCYITLSKPFVNLEKKQLDALVKAENIINKLNSHQLYPHVITHISDNKIDINRKKFISGTNSDILIYRNIIGYVSGNKDNPLDNIYVYKTKDLNISAELRSKKIDVSKYSLLVTKSHQEHITMLFYKYKTPKVIMALHNEFNEFIGKLANNLFLIEDQDNKDKIKNKDSYYIKSRKIKNKIGIFDDLDEQLTYSDQQTVSDNEKEKDTDKNI